MFPLHTKGFATGCQDACLGRVTDDALGQGGRRIDYVLAVVQYKKNFPVADKGEQTAKGILGLHHESQDR